MYTHIHTRTHTHTHTHVAVRIKLNNIWENIVLFKCWLWIQNISHIFSMVWGKANKEWDTLRNYHKLFLSWKEFLVIFFFFLKTHFHYVALAGLELTMQPRYALSSQRSTWLCLPGTGIEGVYLCAWPLLWSYHQNGFLGMWRWLSGGEAGAKTSKLLELSGQLA